MRQKIFHQNKLLKKDNFILGINCAYHESSACLMKNGEIFFFIEEERLNRIKHAKKTNVNKMTNENDTSLEKEHSTSTHISFNLAKVMLPASWGMLATHLFWFYEVEILLPVLLVGIAYILFGVWDAFNDPLVGYLSDKPNRLTKRFGRRFPWILIFGVPLMISLILLFAPPMTDGKTNPWPIFFWLLVILIFHEFYLNL